MWSAFEPQTDSAAAAARQPACLIVWNISGVANRLTHPSASLVTDLAGAIDDVRDRHHGYTRLLSNRIVTAVLLRRRPVLLSITIDDPGGWGKEIGP
jgi:hypothetical protein